MDVHRAIKWSFLLFLYQVVFCGALFAQETKRYANVGVTFDYCPDWEITEQIEASSQRVSLANKKADAQILLIVLPKQASSKDAMVDLKKQIIDPWVTQLVGQYTQAGIKVFQEKSNTDVAGQQAEGSTLKFFLDEQPGRGEAYWTLIEKRLVLLYFIRPDKTAEKAIPGWDSIRKSLKIEATK